MFRFTYIDQDRFESGIELMKVALSKERMLEFETEALYYALYENMAEDWTESGQKTEDKGEDKFIAMDLLEKQSEIPLAIARAFLIDQENDSIDLTDLTLNVDMLYVRKDRQSQGIGSYMLHCLREEAEYLGCHYIRVLDYDLGDSLMTKMRKSSFLINHGFDMPVSIAEYITIKAGEMTTHSKLRSLKWRKKEELQDLYGAIERLLYKEKYELLKWKNQPKEGLDCSVVSMQENTLKAAILAVTKENMVSIERFYVGKKDDLMEVLILLKVFAERFDSNTPISFVAFNPEQMEVFHRIFVDCAYKKYLLRSSCMEL